MQQYLFLQDSDTSHLGSEELISPIVTKIFCTLQVVNPEEANSFSENLVKYIVVKNSGYISIGLVFW